MTLTLQQRKTTLSRARNSNLKDWLSSLAGLGQSEHVLSQVAQARNMTSANIGIVA